MLCSITHNFEPNKLLCQMMVCQKFKFLYLLFIVLEKSICYIYYWLEGLFILDCPTRCYNKNITIYGTNGKDSNREIQILVTQFGAISSTSRGSVP